MTTVGDMMYHMGGVPIDGEFTTGDVYFVDSGIGSNSNEGKKPGSPFATLDYAIGQCTATSGDIIYVMTGHAETTTAIALDVAGIAIKGLGRGRARPTLTATTAATDLLNITVANCHIDNIRFVGAASGVTALVDLSTAADDTIFTRCSFEHAETPLIGITLNADRCEWHDCRFTNSVNGADNAIMAETTSSDCVVHDCIFNYGRFGLDVAAISGSAADAPASELEGWSVDNCQFIGMETLFVDINSSSVANIASMMSNCSVGFAADVADIDGSGSFDASSWGFSDVKVTDNPDSHATMVPATSPA